MFYPEWKQLLLYCDKGFIKIIYKSNVAVNCKWNEDEMVQSVFYESVDKAEAVNNWFNTVLDMPIGITL